MHCRDARRRVVVPFFFPRFVLPLLLSFASYDACFSFSLSRFHHSSSSFCAPPLPPPPAAMHTNLLLSIPKSLFSLLAVFQSHRCSRFPSLDVSFLPACYPRLMHNLCNNSTTRLPGQQEEEECVSPKKGQQNYAILERRPRARKNGYLSPAEYSCHNQGHRRLHRHDKASLRRRKAEGRSFPLSLPPHLLEAVFVYGKQRERKI